MQQRRFIVISLILFFFILTSGLTSCALFENSSGSDLTNAVGMSSENGPGSGQWIPPQPKNRDQCLQLHAIGVNLKTNLDNNVTEMEKIRTRCVDASGEFLPGVDQAECIGRFDQYFKPAELILADLQVGGLRYTASCTTVEGGSDLPSWPQADEEKDEEPKATAVPEATKAPETGTSGGSTCCWCLTCTQRLDTGYILRPLIITPSG